jgi:hypothetical protein
MLLKKSDDKQSAIAELEALAQAASGPVKTRIEAELRNVRAGIKGEQESAYLIDFHYVPKDKWMSSTICGWRSAAELPRLTIC